MYIGEPEISTLIGIGQLQVIDSHQVKDARLQVMDRNRVLADAVTQLIGFPVNMPAPDPAPAIHIE